MSKSQRTMSLCAADPPDDPAAAQAQADEHFAHYLSVEFPVRKHVVREWFGATGGARRFR